MNRLRAAVLFSWGVGVALLPAACDGGQDISHVLPPAESAVGGQVAGAGRCVPGQTLGCMGVCGQPLAGYQVCADDGLSYGQCVCPSADRLDPTPSGGGNEPTMLPRPAESAMGVDLPVRFPGGRAPALGGEEALIGARCQQDAECGAGLGCLDTVAAGGLSGGYCTKACVTSNDCASVDARSVCGTLAGQEGLCLRLCESQVPVAGQVKCLDREDLTCASLVALGQPPLSGDPERGICVPQCQSDAACDGRRCDLVTGLCTDQPTPTAPLGSGCDTAEDCLCLTPSPEVNGFCSAFCTLGVPGCGYDGSEAVIGAACLLPQVPGEGAGDRGLCFELCDVVADCTDPLAICVPAEQSGRAGVCLQPLVPLPTVGEIRVGGACEVDAECGGDLTCLTSSADPFGIGGGPAGGYCSAPCDESGGCSAAGSTCVRTTAGDFCLRACAAAGADDCGGRQTLACADLGGGVGACLPQCNVDADCGSRRCDVGVGLCFDAPECTVDADCDDGICDASTGSCVPAPAGCETDADCEVGVCSTDTGECELAADACSLDAECTDAVCNVVASACVEAPEVPVGGACEQDEQCAGEACVPFGDSAFCSGVCLLGSSSGCEMYGSDAFCLLPLDNPFGLCLELCSTADDCEQAGYDCVELGSSINGRTGACLPAAPDDP